MKDIPEDEDIPEEVIERLVKERLSDDIDDQIDKALNDIQKLIDGVEDGRWGLNKTYYLLALKRLAEIGVEQLTRSHTERLPEVPIKPITNFINMEIENSTAVVAVHKEIE